MVSLTSGGEQLWERSKLSPLQSSFQGLRNQRRAQGAVGLGERGKGRSCKLGPKVPFPQGCPREEQGSFRHRKCVSSLSQLPGSEDCSDGRSSSPARSFLSGIATRGPRFPKIPRLFQHGSGARPDQPSPAQAPPVQRQDVWAGGTAASAPEVTTPGPAEVPASRLPIGWKVGMTRCARGPAPPPTPRRAVSVGRGGVCGPGRPLPGTNPGLGGAGGRGLGGGKWA